MQSKSLPKIWKGTRKRKKSKLSESANDATKNDSTLPLTNLKPNSNLLQAIPEETHSARLNSIEEINGDDVFKLFDEEFSGKKNNNLNKIEIVDKNEKNDANLNVDKEVVLNVEKNTVNDEYTKPDANEQSNQDEFEFEYETDDEVNKKFKF